MLINFDTFEPNILHDLEKFPYPFEDDSIDEIILSHVLEHLGQHPDIFNSIIKELYRVCKNRAIININVPHPRHDDFLGDPTHVRPITVNMLQLYDKHLNQEWQKIKAANSPLALTHKVNFKIKKVRYDLDEKYSTMIKEKKITEEDIIIMGEKYNNVFKKIFIQLEVIK